MSSSEDGVGSVLSLVDAIAAIAMVFAAALVSTYLPDLDPSHPHEVDATHEAAYTSK